MKFTKLKKIFTAGALGFSLIFSAPTAMAADIGSIIGIGAAIISGSAQMNQAKKQIEVLNNTEEGRQYLYQAFREKYGVNTDANLNARLDKIMSDLTNAVGQVDPTIYDKPYLYFVSADKTLNAACGMGHVMMVNTGAFDLLGSDDELAAIVGHEMGHGQKDHVAKGTKKAINKQTLAQIGVSAAGGGTLAGVIGTIALTNSVAHGDRKHETEADNLAWEYILHTNYNPGACAAAMQRLAELYGEKNKSSLLNPSDHPDTDKRRNSYQKKLEEYSGNVVSVNNGAVTVNGKTLTYVAATPRMSSVERAYFVMGNLATAFHNKKNFYDATVEGDTVYLGDQPIIEVAEGDESAEAIAERLNNIK